MEEIYGSHVVRERAVKVRRVFKIKLEDFKQVDHVNGNILR